MFNGHTSSTTGPFARCKTIQTIHKIFLTTISHIFTRCSPIFVRKFEITFVAGAKQW